MKSDEFEILMRKGEIFHDVRLLPECWTVIRVDGRSFSCLTADRFEKPFDARFHDLMVRTAMGLLEDFQGLLAYTESDEISLLLPPKWNGFDRELEKLVSVSAGIASTGFTAHGAEYGVGGHFDSRIWMAPTLERVVDYFRWRQADARRCALNGWAYWTLRKDGLSARRASTRLMHQGVAPKQQILAEAGVDFEMLPGWQRHGTMLYWQRYRKEGFNPQTGEKTQALRRRIFVDEELSEQEDYAAYLSGVIAGGLDLR